MGSTTVQVILENGSWHGSCSQYEGKCHKFEFQLLVDSSLTPKLSKLVNEESQQTIENLKDETSFTEEASFTEDFNQNVSSGADD